MAADSELPGLPAEIISGAWTAMQVAAASVTLAQVAASRVRKWRDKKEDLPEHTELTLSLAGLAPAGDPQLTLVVYDAHTKSLDEIKTDIERELRSRRWAIPPTWVCIQCRDWVVPLWPDDGSGPRCPNGPSHTLAR